MRSTIHPFSNQRQRMQSPDLEINRYEDAGLSNVALHHHDFYEIYLFLSGNVTYNVESRSYLLRSGDLLLISPLELHQPVITPEKELYGRIVLWISKSYLEQLSTPHGDLAACFDINAPNHGNLLRLHPVKCQRITALMDELANELDAGGYGSDAMARGLLTQLLVELNRETPLAGQEHEVAGKSNELITHLLRYINENYAQEITLDQLSKQFFVSKYHLSREFLRLVGTSVYRYIMQKRLIMAKQMILSGQPPTAVFSHCGFKDYSNFYRAFKSEYGISPSEFSNRGLYG